MIDKLKPYPEYKDSLSACGPVCRAGTGRHAQAGGVERLGQTPSGARQAGGWYDPASVKIGYEISFNRYFYKSKALRPLEEIRADLLKLQGESKGLLQEIIGGE